MDEVASKPFSRGLIYEHADQWLIKQRETERRGVKEQRKAGVVMGNVVFYNYNVVYMGSIGTGINMKAVDISAVDGFKRGLQIIHYV